MQHLLLGDGQHGRVNGEVAVLLFVAVKYVPFAPEGVIGVREYTPDLADDVIRPARQAGPTYPCPNFPVAGLVAGHRSRLLFGQGKRRGTD